MVCDLEGRADVLCPVQIHIHDPTIRERRRQTIESIEQRRKSAEKPIQKWQDSDATVSDDYILIDDQCLIASVVPDESKELPYPDNVGDIDDDDEDTDSHGKNESSMYSKLKRGILRRPREDFDLSTTYPLANSHGNAYQEPGSHHARYSEVYSEIAVRNYLDISHEDAANFSVANSHGDHSVMSDSRIRNCSENLDIDRMSWDNRQQANYEIANSHSNYRVFYDSHRQHSDWPTEPWKVNLFSGSSVSTQENQQTQEDTVTSKYDPSDPSKMMETKSESDQSNEPACDIEQCLVQIEESLINIEQNLLHVQDLDIPELRNLLYKSPSIEKSLFEVQDLLFADGIAPVIKKNKPLSLETDEEEEDEDEEDEEDEEVWASHSLTIKDNDDEDGNAGAPPFDGSNEESSDTANVEESNKSGSMDDHSNIDCIDGTTVFREETIEENYSEKAMNFVPNSLSKTLPRRILLDGTKENIRLCSSEPEEPTIDYNLNSMYAEKKLFCHDKCHSRTNSLDENSTFQNFISANKHETGKSSLQNLLFDSTGNSLNTSGKAKSESTLRTHEKLPKGHDRRGSNENRWIMIEAKAEDFRKRIETIASHRRSTFSGLDNQRRAKISKESVENITTNSQERSPIRSKCGDKGQDREKEAAGGKNFEKRKRKKISSRSQSSSENALVPSKLISLSLSLLLAALLQAVRCLTDLVEDAFRSVSYDRNGLLQ